MKKFALILGGAAALLAAPVLAQPGGERPNPDANGDGVVTRGEAEAQVGARFARMDVNKDGKLDSTDRAAAQAARGGAGGGADAAGQGAGRKKGKRGSGGGEGRGDRGPMRADANGDGAVSLAEMRAAAMTRFDQADADKDGKLTGTELQAMRGRHGAAGGPNGAPSNGD